MNICLVEEKNYLFSTDCKSFKIKHEQLPEQRIADSVYLSSILAMSTIPSYGFVNRQILLIYQFVSTHTCNTDIKFLTIEIIVVWVWSLNKISKNTFHPDLYLFLRIWRGTIALLREQMCKHCSVTLYFLQIFFFVASKNIKIIKKRARIVGQSKK